MKGLLFITHQTQKYSYAESAEIALNAGCKQIQLRMKHAEPEEVTAVAIRLKQLCCQCKADLYIDDHVEICREIRATGVHLGKSDMAPSDARRIVGKDVIIGGTANTFDDIQYLSEQGVDYIGLGPFRFTTTKANLSPVLGIKGYEKILEQCKENNINLPILAIGGITKEDIPSLLQTGLAGIALSSTILKAQNPVEEIKKILEIINKRIYK